MSPYKTGQLESTHAMSICLAALTDNGTTYLLNRQNELLEKLGFTEAQIFFFRTKWVSFKN